MKIESVRRIRSTYPISQVWKRLRYFTDINITATNIKQIHGIEGTEHDNNVNKQAVQIGYCIMQAEEYFKAARVVSNPTKPVLLYYGSVSLSRALVLITNDGTSSFDYKRKGKQDSHHGLEFKQFDLSGNLKKYSLADLLNKIICNIYVRGGEPFGHFVSFYKSLIPTRFSIPVEINYCEGNAIADNFGLQTCADMRNIEEMKNENFNCYNLSSSLADCYNIFKELNIRPQLCRGSMKCWMQVIKGDTYSHDKTKVKYIVAIDSIIQEEKEKLLAYLRSKECPFEVHTDIGGSIRLGHRFEYESEENRPPFHFPDAVDDINGDIYYLLDPNKYIHETASLFIIMFCFGMLSRYHPDLWMKMIKENVTFNEFVDSLMQIIERKFPNLILDQMTRTKHSFI